MSEYINYDNSKNSKCAVCYIPAYAYLNNTHFCERHFSLALTRTLIIGGINDRANAKDASPLDKWFREEMFKQNPDIHCQAKYLKMLDGIES